MPKSLTEIVAQKPQITQFQKRSAASRSATLSQQQLSLWESPPPLSEYPLTIEPLPPALQWWNETRYWLIHQESGLRVPGSWTADEAELIQDLSKTWDWSIDGNRRVTCGLQLIALAEALCKRSSQNKGGKA